MFCMKDKYSSNDADNIKTAASDCFATFFII